LDQRNDAWLTGGGKKHGAGRQEVLPESKTNKACHKTQHKAEEKKETNKSSNRKRMETRQTGNLMDWEEPSKVHRKLDQQGKESRKARPLSKREPREG